MTGVNDTGDKFMTSVNNTSNKCFTSVSDTSGKFMTGVADTGHLSFDRINHPKKVRGKRSLKKA